MSNDFMDDLGIAGLGVLGVIALIVVVLAISALFWGWIAMLVFGVIHSFAPGVATIAYGWTAWGIGLLFSIIAGAFKASK